MPAPKAPPVAKKKTQKMNIKSVPKGKAVKGKGVKVAPAKKKMTFEMARKQYFNVK